MKRFTIQARTWRSNTLRGYPMGLQLFLQTIKIWLIELWERVTTMRNQ